MSQDAAQTTDRQEIMAIIQKIEDAWNGHDMHALANLFHEDGIWVVFTGVVYKGRAAIEEGHAKAHKTVYRNSIQRERLEELTFVGPDAAVRRRLVGLTAAPPNKGMKLTKLSGRRYTVGSHGLR